MDAWKTLPEHNLFFRGISAWIGYPRATIFFSVAEQQQGHSSWKLTELTHLAITALTVYSSPPLRLIAFVNLLFSAFAVLLGIHTLYNYFSGNAVSGFTTVILLILILGTTLFAGLSVIGEYITWIYDEIKQPPHYLLRAETNPATHISHCDVSRTSRNSAE